MKNNKKEYMKIYRKANKILHMLIGNTTLNSSVLGSLPYGQVRKAVMEVIKN